MIALRENEPLATSVGVDVTRYLVLATMVSAAMAGAAGALYAHYVRIVDPDVFLFIYTVTMVIMVVTGGKGTLAGPVVGGLIFGLLPEILRAAADQARDAVGDLRRADDPRRLLPARRHRAGRAQLVAGPRQAQGGRAAGRAPGRGGRAMSARAGVELAVDGLTIRFGGLTAVDGMSFEVRTGEVLSLIGPNGAGKTTAFNAITGYIEPAGGTHRLSRHSASTASSPTRSPRSASCARSRRPASSPGAAVLDNVAHRPAPALPPDAARDPARPALGGARGEGAGEGGLADPALRRPRGACRPARPPSLPYGELRLLEVAIALAAKPKLLLLDEPVSGMNPVETASFMKLLARIRALGITVLLVEHDMKMVMGVSDRIVCLNHGRIIASGTPAEIQRNPEVIRAYLGERYVRAQG